MIKKNCFEFKFKFKFNFNFFRRYLQNNQTINFKRARNSPFPHSREKLKAKSRSQASPHTPQCKSARSFSQLTPHRPTKIISISMIVETAKLGRLQPT